MSVSETMLAEDGPQRQSNNDVVTTNQKKRRKKGFTYYCGDQKFIRTFFRLFLPSSAQNLAVIFVIFINNLYLAQFCDHGAIIKTGLGLADPVITFTFIALTAWLSGVSIMLSQYFGNNQYNKDQQIICYAFVSSLVLMVPFVILLAAIPKELIHMTSGIPLDATGDKGAALNYGKTYMQLLSWTFIPLVFSEALSVSLQTTEKAGISLIGALLGTAISIIFDPVAIILTKHDPLLSVKLVAIIDGIARIVQLVFLLLYIYFKKYQPVYIFRKIVIEKEVWIKTLKYGFPSFVNDFLFGIFATLQAISILNYSNDASTYGNIQPATTNVTLIMQFANVIWPGMAAATSVLVGSYLGDGKIPEAKQNAKRALLWAFLVSIVICLIIFGISWGINDVLDKDIDPIKEGCTLSRNELTKLSMHMEWVLMPIVLSQGVFSILYYSVRCGGTKLVVLCDSGIMGVWTIIMASLTFTHKLNYINPIVYIFMIQCEQIIRMISSFLVFNFSHWARNLTASNPEVSKALEPTKSTNDIIY